MESTNVVAVILAAGQGTRMKSDRPKVLHEVAGRTLIGWSVRAAFEAGVDRCVVVVGHGRDQVEAALKNEFESDEFKSDMGARVQTAVQEEQRGTGHAVRCALPRIPEQGTVVITYGDCPLIPPSTLRALCESRRSRALALVTAQLDRPTGYGRILRGPGGEVRAIREEKDCSDAERAVREVNPGIYAMEAGFLREAIAELSPDNAQGELYLTDLVEIAARSGEVGVVDGNIEDLRGVNDPYELALCERRMRHRIVERLARSGVRIADPASVQIDADALVHPGAEIGFGVHIRGHSEIAAGARIDVGCVLENVVVESGARLLPYCVATDSTIGRDAQIGPFAHLRPATRVGERAKVGNFCETKKTHIGVASKVNHLAYVGDGHIGENVNVGAGVIFCNYDGYRKHKVELEDGVFVGSDSQLVAPVKVGRGAYIASGTTVTKDVPADALAIARVPQQHKEDYARMRREREKKGKMR